MNAFERPIRQHRFHGALPPDRAHRKGIDGRLIVDPGIISSRTEAALLIVLILGAVIGGAFWCAHDGVAFWDSLTNDSPPVAQSH
jgi:hypothetical protein